MTSSLFRRLDAATDGALRVQATEWSRGPWDPRALHGGAPSALVAGVLEHTLAAASAADPAGMPMHPSRLTIDLERPVGLQPMTVRAAVVRHGRKVRVVEAEVVDDAGNRLVRASLLGIRRTPDELAFDGAVVTSVAPPPALPPTVSAASVSTFATDVEGPMYHRDAVEHRFARGAFGQLGPATDWIRLNVPVFAGEPVSPLQRVAAAADFGNGISASLPAGWMFINPDLTITLHRLPAGEWVCLDSVTHFGPDGTGSADTELWDESGRLGRSVQNLLIEPPPA